MTDSDELLERIVANMDTLATNSSYILSALQQIQLDTNMSFKDQAIAKQIEHLEQTLNYTSNQQYDPIRVESKIWLKLFTSVLQSQGAALLPDSAAELANKALEIYKQRYPIH